MNAHREDADLSRYILGKIWTFLLKELLRPHASATCDENVLYKTRAGDILSAFRGLEVVKFLNGSFEHLTSLARKTVSTDESTTDVFLRAQKPNKAKTS